MKRSISLLALGASLLVFTACQDNALNPSGVSSSRSSSSSKDSSQVFSSWLGSSSSIANSVRDSDSVFVHDSTQVRSSSSAANTIRDSVKVYSSSSVLASSSSHIVSSVTTDTLQIFRPDGSSTLQAFTVYDTVQVSQGSAIGLNLVTNPSTGYSWEQSVSPSTGSIVLDSNVLCPAQSNALHDSAGVYVPVVAGVPCRETFRFTFNQPGNFDLSLSYVQSWDKSENPEKLWIVVIVK